MMDQEKIVKSYDPVIMRRLLKFIKPYKLPAIIAVLALLAAAAAELAAPVIIQRTFDDHIMARYYRFSVDHEVRTVLEENNLSEGAIQIGEHYYLLENDSEKISADHKDDFLASGQFSRTAWYLTENRNSTDFQQLISTYADDIDVQNDHIIMKSNFLQTLSKEEKSVLRKSDIAGIAKNSGIYFLLLAAALAFMFLQVYLMAYTGQEVMRDIRTALFGHTIRQSLSFLGRTPVGTLVTRITNDVETINEFFTSVAASLMRDFALMGGVVLTLFLLDVRLALITVISLPPVLILTIFFRGKARDAFRRVRIWVSRVNAFLSEHISGMEIVQIFGREKRSFREFSDKNEELLKANLSEMMVFAVFRPMINLFTSISIGTVLYFGGNMYMENTVSLGILIAFVNLVQKFYQPVMDFTEKFTIMQSAMAGGERIFDLIDTQDHIPDDGKDALPKPVKGKIEFDHVSFAYVEDEPVLKNLTLSIEAGETVAIVGYTGAGKTTIANLLTRMWDIQSGSIRIDGTDIRNVLLQDLRKTVQPVQQDVFMFAGTIEDNIRLGADIPCEKIEKAAETVQAAQFIEQLSDGYDTELKESGANLSTGQRQLIAFSRVLAHDPRILILDEATGSIDTETEQLIQEGIKKIMKGRTAIVIAHRLSTIRNADRILVLNEGKLAESGSHEELLAHDGLYAALYRLQYQQQNSAAV